MTAGLYRGLTKSVMVVGELSRTTPKPAVGDLARVNGVAFGGFVFF